MTVSHNSHSGFQMQSWRGRRVNPAAEAGRGGFEPQSPDYREIFITGACENHTIVFTSLQLICNGAPRYRGRIRGTFETVEVHSRTDVRFRSNSNRSREQKKHVLQIIQPEQVDFSACKLAAT